VHLVEGTGVQGPSFGIVIFKKIWFVPPFNFNIFRSFFLVCVPSIPNFWVHSSSPASIERLHLRLVKVAADQRPGFLLNGGAIASISCTWNLEKWPLDESAIIPCFYNWGFVKWPLNCGWPLLKVKVD